MVVLWLSDLKLPATQITGNVETVGAEFVECNAVGRGFR